ncbi:ribonuclease P protein component [Edaphobacter acidisoli]|uniref:Ribonuclease P protein component n=1 Tax=Edaphobacter acidisoli TaxID=2040573 RepID=A0A916RVF5_9BACT|nr:ribonuclease P protein component [Edaphobacter acidisoli]GGA71813.1 ribonuclease P protein component [Edaphobacter acidisoli]
MTSISSPAAGTSSTDARAFRLRKHADYQRVYKASRKQFSKQMTYFFMLREGAESLTPRVGLTVGKVMGKAVDRNRIKRRMREAVRKNLSLLTLPVDVVLHPRRSVIELEFRVLDREVALVFRAIQKAGETQQKFTDNRHPATDN